MAVTAESPVIMRNFGAPNNGESSTSPSSAESSFRELDDAFLQTQTRIWLGEVLQIRFDEEMNISDLLADGELLFEVSEVLSRMLPNAAEAPRLRVNEGKFLASSKSTKRYMPYYNVGSFLKMCKSLGLNGIDLFSPSDVVEKRNTRKVCMCIRSLSKKVRSRDLNVPDFDSVTCTLSMPTYMVEGIRKSLELSQCSSSLSVEHDSERSSRNRYWQRISNSDSLVSNGYSSDNCDDAESSFVDAESNGPLDYPCSVASPIPGSQVTKEYSPSLELQLNSDDPDNDENVQCEYLSPSTPESMGSPCSVYYSDQVLSSTLSSTCLASCITGIDCEANHGCQNGDVNHVPIDWGDISSDDGYRDGNADNDEIGHVSHVEDDSDTSSSDSCSLTRENSTFVGGRDLDVSDGCAAQDCCAGETPLSKFESPDNEQPSCTETGMGTQTGIGTGTENDNTPEFKGEFGCWNVPKYPNGNVSGTGNNNYWKLPCIIDEQAVNDAAKHGMVTSELSPKVGKPESDWMVKDNDLPHELIETINHASSPRENPDCSSSNDGDRISQVEESSFLVDSDVHSSICPCPVAVKSNGSDVHWICANPVAQSQASTQLLPGRDSSDTIVAADIHHSLTQNENEAFDLMVDNGNNAVEMPDMDLNSSPCMVVTENSIKCLNQGSQDTLDGFEDHNIRVEHINGRPVNIEDSTSVNGFSATLCYHRPEAERVKNVEDTDHKHHPCAENTEKAEPEDKGTDKEMPQSKPKRTLIKSVVQGTAIVGLAVFLFHIRKNSRGHIPKVEKQPIEVLKRSSPKHSSQKSEKGGGNSSSVYPAQKLHLGI